MKQQPVPDIIAIERANPPADSREAALRLAQVLRNLDLILPNHVWNYQDVLYAITDREKLKDRHNRTLAWSDLRGGSGSLLPYVGLDYLSYAPEKTAAAYHECGTIGCALGIAQLLWGIDAVRSVYFSEATVPNTDWGDIFNNHEGDTSPEGIAQRLEDAVS